MSSLKIRFSNLKIWGAINKEKDELTFSVFEKTLNLISVNWDSVKFYYDLEITKWFQILIIDMCANISVPMSIGKANITKIFNKLQVR